MSEENDFTVGHSTTPCFDKCDDLPTDIATEKLKLSRKIALRPSPLITQPRYVMAYDIFVPVHPHPQASLRYLTSWKATWPKRFDRTVPPLPVYRR